MTTIGLHLSGTPRDAAVLIALAEACPEVANTPCRALDHPRRGESVLTWPELAPELLAPLRSRGLPLVEVALHGATVRLSALTPGPTTELGGWSPVVRAARDLVEAVRPVPLPGDPLVDEAVFCVPPGGAGARDLLRCLLLLGRDEVEVCRWEGERGAELWVVAAPPPLYLLMQARDERAVVAYARHQKSDLWVEWGHEHPLAPRAAAALQPTRQSALVDRRGRWRRVPRPWPTRGVYDAITMSFDAGAAELSPARGPAERFSIELRLAPGPAREPELWLLSAEEFLSLEEFVEAAAPTDLARLTAARLCDAEGAVSYVLRERLRPGEARATATAGLDSYLDRPGYALTEGSDNLYLPAGERLLPRVRRDELRQLFRLGDVDVVIVRQDRDGPQVVTVRDLHEEPLSRWVDYVATDNRVGLDRLLESTVFSLPGIVADQPPKKRDAPAAPRARRKTIPPRRRPTSPPTPDSIEEVAALQATDDKRFLRARAAELELQISEGGCVDPVVWHELGGIHGHLQQWDDVSGCLEAACFNADDEARAEYVSDLEEHLSHAVTVESGDLLTELVLQAEHSPAALGYLGAAVVRRVLADEPVSDEVLQLALPVFADPHKPVSRRQAWSVLHTWYRAAGDRVGLTRAREALLGGINDHGLSVLHDLPLFVRYRLALEDEDDPRDIDQPRARQTAVLEALWEEVTRAGLPTLDAQANFTRLAFATGFMRLGARHTARRITSSIAEEIDVHDAPNQVLFRLYLARMAHEGTDDDEQAWLAERDTILRNVRVASVRKVATWLADRSAWLGPGQQQGDPGRRLKQKLERSIAAMERGLSEQGQPNLAEAFDDLVTRQCDRMGQPLVRYAYELAVAVERLVNMALRTGREETIADALGAAEGHLPRIGIIGQRCRAIGACVRAASALGDPARAEPLLDMLVRAALDKKLKSASDLARAAIPAVAALRRFGDEVAGRQLLQALESVQPYSPPVKLQLLASVAEGYQLIRQPREADALVDQVMERTLSERMDHVHRYLGGRAVAQALRRWANPGRLPRCAHLLANLDLFRDTFTTSKHFATHKVLLLEQIVDSVADCETRQSDRIQRYLDLEEHAIRRRINSDWSALCGP